AKGLLGELRSELQEAVQELRNLAHGIYPPLLMDEGLGKALAAAVRRAPLPASVEASSVGRYAPEVEATTYFCCMEALQNACKHAGEDATVTISVREADGSVVFEVADDGAGFNPDSRGLGAGFVNMSDRLGTLGGSLRVESSPGRGTRVVGTVPVATGDGQPARPAEAGPSSHRRSVTLTSSAETTS
ncbi:MAG: ATP-binding protein, partial [Actinomycetota bacterium]|nr:ATP-binding protein [Actinomycetota bacterium]